jgi:hypothetical protein
VLQQLGLIGIIIILSSFLFENISIKKAVVIPVPVVVSSFVIPPPFQQYQHQHQQNHPPRIKINTRHDITIFPTIPSLSTFIKTRSRSKNQASSKSSNNKSNGTAASASNSNTTNNSANNISATNNNDSNNTNDTNDTTATPHALLLLSSRKQQWNTMYTLLKEYKDREGDCNVPQRHKEDNENLGTWLSTQRQTKKKGKLHYEKEEKLNTIGIVWDPIKEKINMLKQKQQQQQEDEWNTMYKLLMQYKKREGHCNIPVRHYETKAIIEFEIESSKEDSIGRAAGGAQQKNKYKNKNKNKNKKKNIGLWLKNNQHHNSSSSSTSTSTSTITNENTNTNTNTNNKNMHMHMHMHMHIHMTGLRQEERLEEIGIAWDELSQQWEDMYT